MQGNAVDQRRREPSTGGAADAAIAIDAPAAEVWPRIVQLGADGGGFDSYDRLEDLSLSVSAARRTS
jgi:hypothetical protein